MPDDCIFCKIIQKTIPAKIEFEDEDFVVFNDIAPQAPFHLLVIPKLHLPQVSSLEPVHLPLLGKMLYRAKMIAEKKRWENYRLVLNNGAEAGQSVFHIHLHLLAGRPFRWPPG